MGDKGKGKEAEVRRRAVPEGEVIQTWGDSTDKEPRGFNQAKFEEAYRVVTVEHGAAAAKANQDARAERALQAGAVAPHTADIDAILRELDVSRNEAESAYLANNCQLRPTLLQLVRPPDVAVAR